jgi:hypothetical protein
MPEVSYALNCFCFIILMLIWLYPYLKRYWNRAIAGWKTHRHWQLRPQSPLECAACCAGQTLPELRRADVVPYADQKSRRGRKKTSETQGYACLNEACYYYGVVDVNRHALVSYGQQCGIQRWKCQACGQVSTSRKGAPLYYLKKSAEAVELAVNLLSEGMDQAVVARVCHYSEATVRRWLERMGRHSQQWQHVLLRNLKVSVLQLDELYTRVRSTAMACWVWVAIDPVSKVLVSLHIGGRTKADAFTFVHDVKQRLAADCVPAVSTDGLKAYFYALMAHFGE